MASLIPCPHPATCPHRGAKHHPGSAAFNACVASHRAAAPSAAAAAAAVAAAVDTPTVAQLSEIADIGGDQDDYQWARDAGYTHDELVEIAKAAGMVGYRAARDAGYTHDELVEIAKAGGDLYWYQMARAAGVAHATIVDAVTVHGLPADLLNGFLARMRRAPDADPATEVFELVAGAPRVGV